MTEMDMDPIIAAQHARAGGRLVASYELVATPSTVPAVQLGDQMARARGGGRASDCDSWCWLRLEIC